MFSVRILSLREKLKKYNKQIIVQMDRSEGSRDF